MARRPVDVSFETFLRENPEYSFSQMFEKSPRTEESVLPKGSRGSLRAARRVFSDAERSDWVNREVRSAYKAWRSRRSGSLGYRSVPSVPDQLSGVERFIREFYSAADAQPPQSDIEYEASGEASQDRFIDDHGPMEAFEYQNQPTDPQRLIRDADQSFFYEKDGKIIPRSPAGTRRIPMDRLEAMDGSDLGPMEARQQHWKYREALSEGMMDTFDSTPTALESGESPREASELSGLLDSAHDDEVYERDLGGGRHEIEIDNADPDKRGRFIYDENDDTLTKLKGR